MEVPTISVDRAMPHYLQELNIDHEAIAQYYADLPLEDKAPLSECHIYFSALAWTLDGGLINGAHLRNPEDSKKYDPQAPPANIVIGMGSFLARKEFDTVSETVQHELQHYALKTTMESQFTPEELQTIRMNQLANSMTYRTLGFLVKTAGGMGLAAILTEISDWDPSFGGILAYGLGVATVASIVKYPQSRKLRHTLAEKVKEGYERRPHEVAAHEHFSSDLVLASAIPRNQQPSGLLLRGLTGREKMLNGVIDRAHRQRSLQPAWPA